MSNGEDHRAARAGLGAGRSTAAKFAIFPSPLVGISLSLSFHPPQSVSLPSRSLRLARALSPMHKAVVAEGKRSEGPSELAGRCLRAKEAEYTVEISSDPPRQLTVSQSLLWQCVHTA